MEYFSLLAWLMSTTHYPVPTQATGLGLLKTDQKTSLEKCGYLFLRVHKQGCTVPVNM